MPAMTAAQSVGMRGGPNLLPEGLGVAWAAVFLVVAVSHLRHLAHTRGQRRSWHACHVLMALGMVFMYAPAQILPLTVPAAFWQLVFATTGLIAATWAIAGVGRVSTLIWLLTSVDLGVMLYMWSGTDHGKVVPLACLLATYLIAEGMMWALDLYRRLDGATPIVSWRVFATESGERVTAPAIEFAARSGALLGELDISASMVAMTLGMTYMLVAMQIVI